MEKWKTTYLEFWKKHPHLPGMFDSLFLASFFCYLLCQMLMTTMFPTAFLMGFGGLALQFVIYATLFKLAVHLERWREFLWALPLAIVCLIVSKNIQASILMLYAWAIIGMIGVSYRKVAKIYVIAVGMVVFSAVFSALSGAIPNLVYLEDYGFRDSMGICYPTDFVSYLFYLTLFFWIAWEKIPDWVTLLLCVPLFGVASVLTQSDTCMICTVLFGMVLILFMAWKKFGEKSGLKKLKALLDGLLIGAFPMAGILMFFLIFLRAKSTKLGIRLDGWLTGRLTLAWNSLRENGVRPFGALVSMKGRGGSTFPVAGYTFVDSSYPLLLIKYGWVLTGLICIAWMWIVWKAVKREDYRLAFGMALIAVHSLAEHHFIEAYYNILIVLPFAVYGQVQEREMTNSGKEDSEKRGFLMQGCVCISLVALALITMPIWMSGIRTICGWKNLQEEDGGLGTALFGFVLLISFVILVILGVFYLKKGKKKQIFLFGAVVVFFLGGCLFLKLQLNKALEELEVRLEADAKAVQVISDTAKGKIYASELPTLYHRQFSKVSYHVFMGEDLARYQNATVITSRQMEWQPYFKKGFSYVPISEESAVYSNEANVISALSKEGFSVYEYYPEKKQLKSAAELDLVKGNYTVTLVLEVTEMQERQNGDQKTEPFKLAEINILGFGGRTPVLNEDVFWKTQGEDGMLHYEFPITLREDMSNVVFYLLKSGEIEYQVKDFYVRMTP